MQTKNKVNLSKKKNNENFVVKILTFARGNSENSEGVIKRAIDYINEGVNEFLEKKRELLLYEPTSNEFYDVNYKKINPKAKTLLLIHGTFTTTKGSYGELIGNKWLKNSHIENRGIYDQIIAYDHPTLFAGAKKNINELHDLLGDVVFSKKVDIIATSQGGLLAQYLANINTDIKIPVGKIALVSSANGVDYLTVAGYIPTLFKVLRKMTSSQVYLSFACLIAQHSANFFISRPGMKIMKPKSKELKAIINVKPKTQTPIYLPIIDDYNKNWKNNSIGGLIWRSSLDVLTWTVMGRYND